MIKIPMSMLDELPRTTNTKYVLVKFSATDNNSLKWKQHLQSVEIVNYNPKTLIDTIDSELKVKGFSNIEIINIEFLPNE